ncbi:fibrocystin-L-like [Babylonia areolata]|uniref:fibrocystin-L-like n=1 Tax=Babylonia areolata TaxID=304850 RepID=UPI003FD33448
MAGPRRLFVPLLLVLAYFGHVDADFADNFDLNNDPDVGTHTTLVAGSEYPCDLHVDGVTNITATCYTRYMPEGEYQVKVKVNGADVTTYCTSDPNDCVYTVKDSDTPKIHTLTPRSGVPGTLLSAEAKLFTSRYGSNLESQNSRTEKIVKFWAAGKICNVKDLDTDEYYGLNLYNDTDGNAGDEGYFKCKPDNDYIGNYNVSFIVEGKYGRSLPDPTLLHVHATGKQKIGMYQMYTEMESVSANTGSTEGGQLLTISGQYFDDTDSPARVLIDGEECVLQGSLSSTSLICQTPPSPSATPIIRTANWAAGTVSRLDETYYQLLNYSDHVTKMEGVFVAPETSSFRFYLRSMSSSKFTLLNASSVEMLSMTSSRWRNNGKESDPVDLVKGSIYQIRVETGSSGDSGVELIGRQYNTVYLQTQTGASRAEIQDLVFNSVVEAEVQQLEVTSTGTVTGSEEEQTIIITGDLSHSFIVGFQGVFTGQCCCTVRVHMYLSHSIVGFQGVFTGQCCCTVRVHMYLSHSFVGFQGVFTGQCCCTVRVHMYLSHSIVGFQGVFTEPLTGDSPDFDVMATALNALPKPLTADSTDFNVMATALNALPKPLTADSTDFNVMATALNALPKPLTADSTDFKVMATALNALPSLKGHSVRVTDEQTAANSKTYNVTFPATLGNVEQLSVQAATSRDQVGGSVQTRSAGQSSLEYFSLEFGGAITEPISVTASPSKVRTALEEAAGVRCHEKLSNGRTLMDCEDVDSCAGERVGHEEPFCGRFSAMNPGVLYWKGENEDGYYLDTSSSTLCLAHKGPVTSVWVRFLYKATATDIQSDVITFTVSSAMTSWKYICKDIYALVKSRQPGKTSYQIQGIGVRTDSNTNYDAFVDHMVLNREDTVSDFNVAPLMRMPQARPNGAFLRTVTVTGSSGDYTVTLDPYLCGNTFPLMSLQGASVSGSTASSSNSATFTLSSGGQQVSVTNTRQTRASKPIAGSFTVTFNGKTSQRITVTPDLEVEVVRDKLSLIQGLGDVDVTHDGDCTAFTYTVVMATRAGDQTELTETE